MATPQKSLDTVRFSSPVRDRLRFELEIHDRQQLELECTYPLPQEGLTTHQLELYVFVPRNVGVNAQNYAASTFYTDLIGYLRMDSPPMTMAELSDPDCNFSPLHNLQQLIIQWENSPTSTDIRPITTQIKLFGHSFRESVHSAFLSLSQEVQRLQTVLGSERQNARALFTNNLQIWTSASLEALDHFRVMRRRLTPIEGTGPMWARDIIEQVHEYATAYLVEKIGILSTSIQEQGALHDGSGFVASTSSLLAACAKEVAIVRKQEGFVNPNPALPRTTEFATYRRGLIKKALQQAFYLETRHLKRDEFRKNASAMIAAGLAAIWTVFLFPLFAVPSGSIRTLSSWSSLIFIGLLLFFYALRDRFQEFTRNFFFRKLRHYDHDTTIVGENLEGIGLDGIRGEAREKMTWSTPGQLSTEIVYLRTHPRTVTGTDISTEEVLVYQRVLSAGPQEKTKLHPGFSIRDALRLNLRHFMTRLDDPQEIMHYYDLEQSRFVQAASPKVYHLNLIVRITELDKGERLLTRHRVVINKEQILRVEQINPGEAP